MIADSNTTATDTSYIKSYSTVFIASDKKDQVQIVDADVVAFDRTRPLRPYQDRAVGALVNLAYKCKALHKEGKVCIGLIAPMGADRDRILACARVSIRRSFIDYDPDSVIFEDAPFFEETASQIVNYKGWNGYYTIDHQEIADGTHLDHNRHIAKDNSTSIITTVGLGIGFLVGAFVAAIGKSTNTRVADIEISDMEDPQSYEEPHSFAFNKAWL